jgi:hypothetical protein
MVTLDAVLDELRGMGAAVGSAGVQASAAGAVLDTSITVAQGLGLHAVTAGLAGVSAAVGELQARIGVLRTSIDEATEPVARAPTEVTPAGVQSGLDAAIQLIGTVGGYIEAARGMAGVVEGDGAAALDGGDAEPLTAALRGVTEALARAAERRFAVEQMITEVISRTGAIGGQGKPTRAGGVTPTSPTRNDRPAATGSGSSAPRGFDARGRLPRHGSRTVYNQGPYPTCGPVAAGMLIDTMEQPHDLTHLVRIAGPRGTYPSEVLAEIRAHRIDAELLNNLTVQDLARRIGSNARGNLAVALIYNTTGTRTEEKLHYVVVDGVTTRMGHAVVAIRDPWGIQYFETVEVFARKFTGQAVVTNYSY